MIRLQTTATTLMLLSLMACSGNKGGAASGAEGADGAATVQVDTTAAVLKFESVELSDSSSYKAKIQTDSNEGDGRGYRIGKMTCDYTVHTIQAVAGPAEVVKFINQWLTIDAAEESVEVPATVEKVANKYAELKAEGVTDVRSAFKIKGGGCRMLGNIQLDDQDEDDIVWPFESGDSYYKEVNVQKCTKSLLVIRIGGSEYAACGVHPMPFGYATTFDLKHMRQLTLDDIIKPESQPVVLKMIRKDLIGQGYGETMNEVIDFPSDGATLSDEGVDFAYGAYEIGPYAMGMPSVTFSYQQMQPYFTPLIKELLEESN